MCLAVPARILSIDNTSEFFAMGTVDFGGVRREINLTYVPEAKAGDYVLVHVGVAISVMDEAEAEATLSELRTLAGELDITDEVPE